MRSFFAVLTSKNLWDNTAFVFLKAHKEALQCERVHSVFTLFFGPRGLSHINQPPTSIIPPAGPRVGLLHCWARLTRADTLTASIKSRHRLFKHGATGVSSSLVFHHISYTLHPFSLAIPIVLCFDTTYFSCPCDPASSTMRSSCHD